MYLGYETGGLVLEEICMNRSVASPRGQGGTIGTKGKGLVKGKVTPQEICDFIDKLEMPIFTAHGVNQLRKWQEQKKKWGIK
jgi:hypothetical protein